MYVGVYKVLISKVRRLSIYTRFYALVKKAVTQTSW